MDEDSVATVIEVIETKWDDADEKVQTYMKLLLKQIKAYLVAWQHF